MLKGFILSIEDVVSKPASPGIAPTDDYKRAFGEVVKLVKFLQQRGVHPVVVVNQTRMGTNGRPYDEVLNEIWGDVRWYIADRGTGKPRPTAGAIEYVLQEEGWQQNEVVLLGNTELDMKTAMNGGVLFLNAEWYGSTVEYGLKFKTPREVARFVDMFCLREHLWHIAIEDGDLRFYALSPYGWLDPGITDYSRDARKALKDGSPHTDFWIKYLGSSIYFSGLYNEVDYVTSYPGSKRGAGNSRLDQFLRQFANSFKKRFIPDLIIRHTDTTASHTKGAERSHKKQIESVCLSKTPLKSGTARYKTPPLKHGKTVLVVDDFCTEGTSFEAARAYIEATGAKAICVSCLKSIKPYRELLSSPIDDPYSPTKVVGNLLMKDHQFNDCVIDEAAPGELDAILKKYDAWHWPSP